MYDTSLLDAEAAFRRYEAIRSRLPQADFPPASVRAASLAAIAGQYDAFVLDAFGVLNVGERAISGAPDRIADLRAAGKAVIVLTNAASYTRETAVSRYRALGFDFAVEEIVSSRDVAAAHLDRVAPGIRWAAIAAEGDTFEDIAADVSDLLADDTLWDTAGGFLFLSSIRWSASLQERLAAALGALPRPLVIANPDLVAPRDAGLSVEPGFWGHDIQDRTGQTPFYFGKPFPDAFHMVRDRLKDVGPTRVAMVGDTLHTDILGGRSAGFETVLVTAHGLFAGLDVADYVVRSGIVPDVTAVTT
ncbi:MAG: HAD-IIA family hydrolase [Pseudomonadota bacterium]